MFGKDANSKRAVGGAIYVYYNFGDGVVDSSKTIITPGACKAGELEKCINAQFGYAVSSVGDINGDGYHGRFGGMETSMAMKDRSVAVMCSVANSAIAQVSIKAFG